MNQFIASPDDLPFPRKSKENVNLSFFGEIFVVVLLGVIYVATHALSTTELFGCNFFWMNEM